MKLGKIAEFDVNKDDWRLYIERLEQYYLVNEVNSEEVVEWVKNPTPIDEYRQKACRRFTPSLCRRFSCGPLRAPHNGLDYWLQICNVCPRVYPWLGNALGQ